VPGPQAGTGVPGLRPLGAWFASWQKARQELRRWLDRAQAGAEVLIERRGQVVARLVGPERVRPLPRDLAAFRASVKIKGRAMSDEVVRARRRERY
jgi:antitoxin (DNA-binding transcriptional repressor) of toxin-antitoxin stability system